jgi:hypothetical protein
VNTTQHIQQTVISVIRRVQEGHHRAKAMDWMDICNVPNLNKSTKSNECSEWWDDAENNVWNCWDTMDFDQVLA